MPFGEPGRREEGEEGDGAADQAVKEVVVRGQHDRSEHRRWHQPAEEPRDPVAAEGGPGDAHQQVPAEVEAGDRGVLVDEGRWLQYAVRRRLFGDGVNEAVAGQESWWCDGEDREDQQSDRPGDEHGIAESGVLVAVPDHQPQQRDGEHRPVPVDVEVADGVDQPAVIGDCVLQAGLGEDAGGLFELDDPLGIAVRQIHPGLDQATNTEVEADPGEDHHDLPRHPPLSCARQPD
jgi:hypothetical protein